MPKFAFTDLFVTINTHIAPDTEEARDYVIRTLDETIEKWLELENLSVTMPCSRNAQILSVDHAIGDIEQGDQQKKIHTHLNLSIYHQGKLKLTYGGKNINKRIKEWFDAELPWETGVYVRADLLSSSRAKNYNIRSGTDILPDIVVTRDPR